MVVVSRTPVCSGGVRMVGWAIWVTCFTLCLTHVHANVKYVGDVSGEDVVIDQLNDFLRSRHSSHKPPVYRPNHQDLNEKIDFAVTPKDPRYYLPLPQSSTSKFSPPDLIPRGREYPPDLLQYQDDPQYPQEYPSFNPQYKQGDEFSPKYLRIPDLQYPDLYPDSRFLGPDPAQGFRESPQDFSQDFPQGLEGRVEEKRLKEDKDEELLMQEDDNEVEDEVEKDSSTSQPEEMNYSHRKQSPAHAQEPGVIQTPHHRTAQMSDVYFAGVVAGLTAMAVCGVVGAGICWYRLNKSHRAAQDAEYPAYGVTGPNKDLSPSSGDRKLAQSAHMYHYQHQKQQMIALDNRSSGTERHGSASDVDSEEEGEENEYTVYECPGLAPTDEMEVKNPLFHDDPTPATPSVRKEAEEADEDEEEEPKDK